MVAFEPHPGNAEKLRTNVAYNDLADDVTVLERALGDGAEVATLHVSEAWDTMHSLVAERDGTTERVEVVPGDGVAAERGRPDVVQIDVEGAEMAALSGMVDGLRTCRTVFCEVHHDHVDEAGVRERLRAEGFEVSEVQSDDATTNLVARRATASSP
ncbi:MAG: FkbM family methyltransferase [Halobacteriales archaeon]